MGQELKNAYIRLRLARHTDAAFIHALRKDEDLTRFVSAIDGGVDQQIAWLKAYEEREKQGSEYYFIIEHVDGTPLGTVRIYDIREDSFCWGSWIILAGSPPQTGISSALLLYEFAFDDLGFARSHFDVRKGNEKVSAFHLRMGAVVTGEDELNFYFNYDKEAFEPMRDKYSKYLRAKNPE
jgi:RimJ/RimL family protein N-acetyltransferase